MGRYDTTMNILGMLGQSVNAVQNRNLQESIATNQLNENKRTFDLNMGFQTDARDWTRRLTGEARDRSEQELLVDTEVSKNPYKFAKGWRKTADGKIEPYAYELSKDQIKRMSNQNNGATSSKPSFVTFTPDGMGMVMSDNSIVPIKQSNPEQANTKQVDTWDFLSFLPQPKFNATQPSQAWKMPMAFWSFYPRGKDSGKLEFSPYFDREKNETIYPPNYSEWMNSREPGIENDYSLLAPVGSAMVGQTLLPFLNLFKKGGR